MSWPRPSLDRAAVHGAALAGLPGMGPARLAEVLTAWPPEEAWRRVTDRRVMSHGPLAQACRPDPAAVADAWRRQATTTDLGEVETAYRRAGVGIALRGGPHYPDALSSDVEPPAVLFHRGDVGVVAGPAVAVIGTRRCTRYGREIAHQLGRELSAAGCRVVSGLALGVDGEAHRGALVSAPGGAPPVGVVGSGLDVVYPRRNAELWGSVAEAGVLLGEAPLGAPPEGWRFPARNRIIAAVATVVVVVESHARGGSANTVEHAMVRDRQVMAVPGSIRSSASELPNQLLADGCHPVRDVTDVLVALGLVSAAPPDPGAPRRFPPPTSGLPDGGPTPAQAAVLDALGWEPATLEGLVLATGRPPAEVSVALAHLESGGWVTGRSGWWERTASGRGR